MLAELTVGGKNVGPHAFLMDLRRRGEVRPPSACGPQADARLALGLDPVRLLTPTKKRLHRATRARTHARAQTRTRAYAPAARRPPPADLPAALDAPRRPQLVAGVSVGDMGIKSTGNDLDNAWIRFDQVRRALRLPTPEAAALGA